MGTDYRQVGLKCGLEVHQQLDTGKLFSRTPSELREDAPGYRVVRRLRPVLSEIGEYDKAALEAFRKGRHYVYEGYSDSVSLVELDEEPPQPVDEEALKTVLEVAAMCGSTVMDEVCVMRKLVIDGSNTSGFQRTALVAVGGSVRLNGKELGIQTIVLEEDAARPMEKTHEEVRYRLDRLGMPLIEIATEPWIETPEDAKEAARQIGSVLRLTGKVKRGLGTIRQDLNISIRGGARVEIKGVQDLEIIDEYVKREVQRQQGLLSIKAELGKRGSRKATLAVKDLGKELATTEARLVKSCLSKGEAVMGAKLEGFSGLLGMELQPGRRLGTELADQVKVKTGLKGLFHSDELPGYGISAQEKDRVASALGCSHKDAFIMVCGPREKCGAGLGAAFERAMQCAGGVPEETRGALEGGNNEYLRPLPGAARMYPETDLETVLVGEAQLKSVRSGLPRSVEEREKLYFRWGLSTKLVNEMKLSNYARLFEKSVEGGADAKKTAVLLLEGLVEARREGADTEKLGEKELTEFIEAMKKGSLTKEIMTEMLVQKCRNTSATLEQLMRGAGAEKAGSREVEEVVKRVVARNASLVRQRGTDAFAALMGDVMKELRGKAAGREVSDALRREIGKTAKT